MAEGAKVQLKDQLGPEYEDINWRQYDPRQYDPRRIVRKPCSTRLDDAVAPVPSRSVPCGPGKGLTGGSRLPGGSGRGRGRSLRHGIPGGGAPVVEEPYISTRATPLEWDPARPTVRRRRR
jgi:hypothetical protein